MDLHKASFYVVNPSPQAFSCEFLQDSGLISAFIVFCSFTSISVRIWELLHQNW